VKILYVDPMSRKNLGLYDKNLLENIEGERYFFASYGLQFKNILNTSIIYNYNYYNKKGINKAISYIFSQIKLFRWILRNKPDIIHIQWIRLPLFDAILLFILKMLCKKSKLLFTAHDLLPHDTGRRFYFRYNILYHLFDGIIVHEKKTKDDITKLFNIFAKKICVIPHGMLEFNVVPVSTKVHSKKFVFSIAGSIHYYKGIDILIDAWLLNNELINNDSILLIIAGSGKLPKRSIPEKSNIKIINKLLTDEEYQSIINNTDIGILPYRQISQSGVLLSLLTQHKPVIVSKCGGLLQPFEIGRVGWILDELSPECLSEIITTIVNDDKCYRQIKNDINLWKNVDEYYSWHRIGRMTYEYYDYIYQSK
jgi:glycosyltransferase involved in cell wall biosynthesis